MDEFREITQQLLRFSPDALVVIDDGNQIRFASDTVQSLFGHTPPTLLGKPLEILIPERLRTHHIKHTADFMRNPTHREMGVRTVDLYALRADGSEFAAGIRLAPFHVEGRCFVAAAIRDTTDHRIIKEELIAARQEADRANRAKSRFLATASHDLRQPMQTIRLLNATMMRMASDAEVGESLRQQGQAIESMTRLLNALLDISRLESGAIEPVSSEVSVAKVFEELRAEFASVARAREVDLRVAAVDMVLATDRTLFYQLLQNLLGNALKYTDSGWVELRCYTNTNAVVIAVEDSGIGIPGDKLKRIFDEYYQVDTHGAKRMGVGLGLAIVKEVARLLNFSVQIHSKLGEGTQVVLSVPMKYRVLTGATGPEAMRVHTPQTQARKPRIILVEDNDGVRLATELFLKVEGHETLSARSMADAKVLLERIAPGDVIIADYHLDGANTGLDLILGLRERLGYDVPAIVLSGDLPSVHRSIRTSIAACHFLSKPVDTAALLEVITALSLASRNQISNL